MHNKDTIFNQKNRYNIFTDLLLHFDLTKKPCEFLHALISHKYYTVNAQTKTASLCLKMDVLYPNGNFLKKKTNP